MEAAMDLTRRMPPFKSQQALASLLALLPAHSSELLSRTDQPIQVAWDEENSKHYLLCDYNRDGDSYRSPWSSKYLPELVDGVQPSPKLRKLEQEANEIFSIYRDHSILCSTLARMLTDKDVYYEGGISSVYLWEPEDGIGFAACFLIKKDGSDTADGRRGLLQQGLWDAIHVIEVRNDESEQYGRYCLTSTVMLALTTAEQLCGSFSLSGSITRQMEADMPIQDGHLCNMGRLIEEMESKLRNGLDQVYFGKTKEVVFTLREPVGSLSASSRTGVSLQRTILGDLARSQ